MARQKGVLTLEGKAGKLTFIHGRDGFTVRSAEGINGRRVLTDSAFERTRENAAEFGRACKGGKLLRNALRGLLPGMADGRVTGRLAGEMLRVVKSDGSNDRGMRTASLGNVKLLEGFEFNAVSPLKKVFGSDVTATVDKTAGSGKVSIPVFNPKRSFAIPESATHYVFHLGLVWLDFDHEVSGSVFGAGEVRELVNVMVDAEEIEVVLPQAVSHSLFFVFGVEFMQVVNGKAYVLKDLNASALKLMVVE